MENKPAQKAPDDLIYDQVDLHNREEFIKKAEKQLGTTTRPQKIDERNAEKDIEKYRQSFRNYYYTNQILNDSKNNQFFEQAIREVHSGVKLKSTAKNILRLVNKVFVQQLAETCFEIMSKTGAQDVDQEVVEDAYRLMQKRKSKHNKFGKLFGGAN